jgi:hypothetical protein
MTVDEVLQKNQERLMTLPEVVGVGEGEQDGTPVVVIMVKQMTPELKNSLPRQLDGYPVRIDVTGEVSAF